MNATQPAARRLAVTALVTVAVAAWFVIATGAAFTETNQRGVAAAAPTQVTLTPAGTMKLTVVAARPATQITMTPEGTMKLTVVAQRTQDSGLRTAAIRGTSNS